MYLNPAQGQNKLISEIDHISIIETITTITVIIIILSNSKKQQGVYDVQKEEGG